MVSGGTPEGRVCPSLYLLPYGFSDLPRNRHYQPLFQTSRFDLHIPTRDTFRMGRPNALMPLLLFSRKVKTPKSSPDIPCPAPMIYFLILTKKEDGNGNAYRSSLFEDA
jgi:hypothetical protein